MPYEEWQLGRLRQGLAAYRAIRKRRRGKDAWSYVAGDMLADEEIADALGFNQMDPEAALAEALRRFFNKGQLPVDDRLDAIRMFLERKRLLGSLESAPDFDLPFQTAQLLRDYLTGGAGNGKGDQTGAGADLEGSYEDIYDTSQLTYARSAIYISNAGDGIFDVREDRTIHPVTTTKRIESHGELFDVAGFQVPQGGAQLSDKVIARHLFTGWGVWAEGNLMLFMRHQRDSHQVYSYVALMAGATLTFDQKPKQPLSLLRITDGFSGKPLSPGRYQDRLLKDKIEPNIIHYFRDAAAQGSSDG